MQEEDSEETGGSGEESAPAGGSPASTAAADNLPTDCVQYFMSRGATSSEAKNIADRMAFRQVQAEELDQRRQPLYEMQAESDTLRRKVVRHALYCIQ